MKITEQLKGWLREHKGVAADADEDTIRQAAAMALVDGSLPHDEFVKLTTDPVAKTADEFSNKIDEVLGAIKAQGERLAKLESPPQQSPIAQAIAKSEPAEPVAEPPMTVKHITAAERYNNTKSVVTYGTHDSRNRRHPLANMPVSERSGTAIGRPIQTLSDRDKAVIGAYMHWKFLSDTGGRHLPPLNDHEKELLEHAMREYEWGGVLRGQGSEDENAIGLKGVKLSELQRKALIDDSTSGGLEAVPIVFDDAVILPALLYGEFYPYVDVKPITRGRRVEGVTFGELTGGSSSEDTNISLFSTAAFVSAFDTTIFVWAGAIQVGLDFMADSPVDVASILTEAYGQAFLKWIDTQICVGDGTTEPEGFVVAAGIGSVSSTNGNAGPPTVGDYEALLFGVTKPYRQGTTSDRIVYASTETTYRRARAIYVGTSDARRVFGMTHEDYMLFGHPYKINAGFANTQAAFVNLARYRCYRRLGMTLRMTTEGQTLARLNEMLIVARARFGGNLTQGAACAYCSDMQT